MAMFLFAVPLLTEPPWTAFNSRSRKQNKSSSSSSRCLKNVVNQLSSCHYHETSPVSRLDIKGSRMVRSSKPERHQRVALIITYFIPKPRTGFLPLSQESTTVQEKRNKIRFQSFYSYSRTSSRVLVGTSVSPPIQKKKEAACQIVSLPLSVLSYLIGDQA
ncbi:hypothetical protein GALMADRAFT_495053 [Galerina marginata CBS 339.88]|uniref:Uncharacterized protein n=1 Tax=Galerina marginata (strain CBS 339.88) TaxID=685588 RepID=A0A067T6X5_GALM3|nr:hypothetical protein GALMADRAFT_495053 [Galerina marginata CBS 339.88]